MSQENVDALVAGFEAFNTGDVARILAFTHPDFEAEVPPQFSAEPDTYRGHDGVRRYFQSFRDAMDEVRFQPEQLWDAGESVVATVRLTAKGRHTAIPVEQRSVQVWTVCDGRAKRVRVYASLQQALAAVGLTE